MNGVGSSVHRGFVVRPSTNVPAAARPRDNSSESEEDDALLNFSGLDSSVAGPPTHTTMFYSIEYADALPLNVKLSGSVVSFV